MADMITYVIHYRENPPSMDVLKDAIKQLGERKKLFNTNGLSYRNLGSKAVKAMSDSEALEALALDGKLIKRPLLITEKGQILVRKFRWRQLRGRTPSVLMK